MRTQSDAGVTVSNAPASRPLLRALLGAFAAVLLLFVAYEIVDRLWLADADARLLHALQRVRGALAALIAAGVASWLILREGPPVLAAGMLPADVADAGTRDPARKQIHYARWFIMMRWIAVVVAAVAVFFAVEVGELLPRHVGPSLGAIIVLLTIVNLGYAIYLRNCGAGTTFLSVQVYVDMVILILLLHFSGGIENPLTALLLLHVIIAGIVLGRAQAYLVAAVASVLFGLLAWAEGTGFVPHYTLRVFPHQDLDGMLLHAAHDPLYASSRVVLQAVVLLLVAYFTTTLVRRILQDENELHAMADHARAQAQMLERALDTTGTALCLCDGALRPWWSNPRWDEWQASAPEVCCSVGMPASPAKQTLADGVVRTVEVRAQAVAGESGAAGGERVFELTTAPLRDAGHNITHVVTLARDVTRQHETRARASRAERLAGVGELAGKVAHEVNNPIAIISAKARLLLREGRHALPAHAGAELVKIAELSDRVARIAQGLLSYCRPAPGARQPIDVRLPARRALAYIEARASTAGVRIDDALPDELLPVRANAAELEQVFLNLFINALDAMPSGGTVRVTGRIERASAELQRHGCSAEAGDIVILEVADTGSGLDASIRERVFEPFLTTKGGGGTGLGLSICQGLVRSHGGEIRIDNDAGRGARVTLLLPVHTAAAAAVSLGASLGAEEALDQELRHA
jgi:signal transduction histidine kinase